MLCKHLTALYFWCHLYHIVLIPLIHSLYPNKLNTIPHQDITSHFQRHPVALPSTPFLFASAQASHPIQVEQNKIALTQGHEIALRCNIKDHPEAQFLWHRKRIYRVNDQGPHDNDEHEISHTNDRFIVRNDVLIIKSPTLDDVGDYRCTVTNPQGDMDTDAIIMVRAKPYIHEFDVRGNTLKSANFDEGESLKIVCDIIDDYVPENQIKITWLAYKFDENDANEIISGENGIEIDYNNATSRALSINKLTKDHRRFYKCHVNNGIVENSKTIYIRVKDKYILLWPTVGIVIELVILIGVICVVENRKVEPDKVNSDRRAI